MTSPHRAIAKRRTGFSLFAVLIALLALAASSFASAEAEETQGYIVVFEDSVDHPGLVAQRQVAESNADLGHVYKAVIEGYSAEMTPAEMRSLREDPRVAYIEQDQRGGIAAQTTPTGIDRIFASANVALGINGKDDRRVDVDVAILDTPVDDGHPDLNVVGRVDCTSGTTCTTDTASVEGAHGTHVAGTVGALDNEIGVVGVAPGARLWGVKVLEDTGYGVISDYIAGIDWVTNHAGEIEAANASLRFLTSSNLALKEALEASVNAGVVHVVAAGNDNGNAANYVPANHPDVITVSATADFDGKPGGEGSPPEACSYDNDDTGSNFSSWGSSVEITAPGSCILSTSPFGSGYTELSGTSMASPHVAGAAALLASVDDPTSKADVESIADTLIEEGNFNWKDDSEDGVQEPLLDLSDDAVFKPHMEILIQPAESDVDGDGRADLVTVDTSGTAHVFKGTATGIESSEDLTSLGSVDAALFDGEGEYLVDVADMDGDGYSDLTTLTDSEGEPDSGVLSVYPGTGSGQFGEPVVSFEDVATGLDDPEEGSIEPIAVADVTGDDRGDFITFDSSEGRINVHPGRSDRTFDAGVDWGNGEIDSALFDGTGHHFFEVADVDGDERADLVSILASVSSPTGTARPVVFTGNSDGTFDEGLLSPGIPPIVMEDGGASFDNPFNAPGTPGWEPIDVADVGGDGRADLVVHRGSATRVYPGQENGKFNSTSVSSLSSKINSSLVDRYRDELVGVIDTNGDGRGDLVFAQDGSTEYDGEVMRALGEPGNSFEEPEQWLTESITSSRFDTNPGHQMAIEKPFWRRDATNCTPIRCEWRPQPTPEQIDSDVDGDGGSDLVTIDGEGDANVYPAGADSFGGNMDSALFDDRGDYAIDVADVDDDGYDDLITAENGLDAPFPSAVKVHLGSGSGEFDAGVVVTSLTLALNGSGGAAEPIAVEDINGDENADLVYFNHTTGMVVGMLGLSDGSFSSEYLHTFSSSIDSKDSALLDGTGSYFLDVADVNGDNRGDLVRWEASSGEVRVNEAGYYADFESTSTLLATADPIMDDGEGSEPIAVADVDGDNKAEWISLADDGSVEVDTGSSTIEAVEGPIDSSLTDGTGEDLVGVFDTDEDGTGDLVAIDDEGTVLRYTGNSNHTFDEPEEWFEENVVSDRFDQTPGEEPVVEKPIWRRAGCTPGGCDWPPFAPPSGPEGKVRAYQGEGSPGWECGGCETILDGDLELGFLIHGGESGTVKADCHVRLDVIVAPYEEEAEEGVVPVMVQGAELSTNEGSPAACGEGKAVEAQGLPWTGSITYLGDDFFQAEIDVDFGGGSLLVGKDWAGPMQLALDVDYSGIGQPGLWTAAETGGQAVVRTFEILPGKGVFADSWLRGSLAVDGGYANFLEVWE